MTTCFAFFSSFNATHFDGFVSLFSYLSKSFEIILIQFKVWSLSIQNKDWSITDCLQNFVFLDHFSALFLVTVCQQIFVSFFHQSDGLCGSIVVVATSIDRGLTWTELPPHNVTLPHPGKKSEHEPGKCIHTQRNIFFFHIASEAAKKAVKSKRESPFYICFVF